MFDKLFDVYMLLRLHSHTGTMLIFWPCAFGVATNMKTYHDLSLIPVFLVGCILMRSAGCVINDMWDRKIDILVERTQNRPIASGRISMMFATIILLSLLMCASSLLVFFSTNSIMTIIATFPIVVIYPLMKRITYWPQLVLGTIFNSGILVACMQINDHITWTSLALYFGCICWTLGYDTIYAFMDHVDDQKVGVKSLAIKLLKSNNYKLYLYGFYIMFMGGVYYSISSYAVFINYFILIFATGHAMWQIATMDIAQMQNCMTRFESNTITVIMIFCSMIHMT
jgi:4-hydroxybenzoate polyprenyltransferase